MTATKRTNIRESVVEAHLCAAVRDLGGLCIKLKDPARRGAPDRLVIAPWRGVYFVELKRPRGGRLGDHQKRYHRDLSDLGQAVESLWSIAEVDNFIARIAE